MGIKIVGGATLPTRSTQLNASIPLAELRADDDGISVRLRPKWLGSLIYRAGFSRPESGEIGWSVEWPELDRAIRAHRSVVLYPKVGRGCRFVTRTSARMEPIIAALIEHEIPMESKPSTWGSTFRL